jgi:hypothetical protein
MGERGEWRTVWQRRGAKRRRTECRRDPIQHIGHVCGPSPPYKGTYASKQERYAQSNTQPLTCHRAIKNPRYVAWYLGGRYVCSVVAGGMGSLHTSRAVRTVEKRRAEKDLTLLRRWNTSLLLTQPVLHAPCPPLDSSSLTPLPSTPLRQTDGQPPPPHPPISAPASRPRDIANNTAETRLEQAADRRVGLCLTILTA